jgi:diguanylate cyclase (GGDEF)-like protein
MRVVLVDPSRTAAKYVGRLLEGRGHEVRCFCDGREALTYIESDPEVGALITSAEPLSMSGLELCWETRLLATAQRPIYVIMMSGRREEGTMIAALDHGADDFIGKPPVAEELYARLRAAERFASLQRELLRLATTDPLTGLHNRRAFFERADALHARAMAGEALSAIMIDIDHFKRVNDVYGHGVGDAAISAVAKTLDDGRAVVGRIGGEEFVLLLDGRPLPEAAAIAEQLRARIAMLEIKTAAAIVTLTCSFGVSEWRPGDTLDQMLKRADMALYEAKLEGRNRVVAAPHPTPSNGEAVRRIRSVRKSA